MLVWGRIFLAKTKCRLSHFQLFVKVNLRFIQGLLELDVDILKLDRSVLTLEVVWCTIIKCTYII